MNNKINVLIISDVYAFGKYNKLVYEVAFMKKKFTHTIYHTGYDKNKIIENIFKHHSKDFNMSEIIKNINIETK
jgi:hypothetical protein